MRTAIRQVRAKEHVIKTLQGTEAFILQGEHLMSHQNPPLLLTVKEVSKLLRIHRPKVYILIKSGGIDGFKVGSDWRIRRDSVEKLVGPIPPSFFTNAEDEENDEQDFRPHEEAQHQTEAQHV